MRVIIIDNSPPHNFPLPLALLPVLDRPLLQRMIEHWVSRGATRFDIFLRESAAEVEAALGSGSRWGVELRWHVTRPQLHALELGPESAVVLGTLGAIPPADYTQHQTWICLDEYGDWTGWAQLLPCQVQQLLLGRLPEDVPQVFQLKTDWNQPDASLRTQLSFLQRGLPEARQIKPGVWVAPGANVHPTAELLGPVYLGPNTYVGARASIGPEAVMAAGSGVGAGARLRHTYLAEGNLVSKDDAPGRITALSRPKHAVDSGLASRFIALTLLFLSWPLLLWRRPQRQRVCLGDREADLFTAPLPAALWEVVRGHLKLLGSRPRNRGQLASLPAPWSRRLQACGAGLWGCHRDPVDDLYFCAQKSTLARLKLLLKELSR